MGAGTSTEREARGNRMVLEHLWMAENLVRSRRRRGRLPEEDALQTAALAMVEASRQERCEPGIARRYMITAACHQLSRVAFHDDHMGEIPDYLVMPVTLFFKERARAQESGARPGFDEIFDRLPPPTHNPGGDGIVNMTEFRERVREAVAMSDRQKSAPEIYEGVGMEEESPLDALERRERSTLVRKAIRRLPKRERQVLSMFWGIGGPPRSLRQIGEAIGRSRDTAGTILREGERLLVPILRSMGLGD